MGRGLVRKALQKVRSKRDRDIKQNSVLQDKANALRAKVDGAEKEIQRYKAIEAHREGADLADLDPRSQLERLQKINAKLSKDIEELNKEDTVTSREYRRLENELMQLRPQMRALRSSEKPAFCYPSRSAAWPSRPG